MTNQVNDSDTCRYELADGFHQITLMDGTTRTFDQFLEMMAYLYGITPEGERLNVLLDLRQSGFPPLQYAFQTAQSFFARHRNRPVTRFAFLHGPTTLAALAKSFFGLLRLRDEGRFFALEETEQAKAWLIRADATHGIGTN
ncbi:MAG: STAS/SEC14 domain-containing protein [Burkholderiales bacterium]|nr:STAS/SEC14 domain-containing protein [Anaerolineae bacterium]